MIEIELVFIQLIEHISVSLGIWTAIPALSAGKTWIHLVIDHHTGIVAFLILDALVLISATTLTIIQASQVNEESIFLYLDSLKIFRAG